MYYVYVLRCADSSLYTGYTDDPVKRARVHNSGKGAKYTRARLPVAVIYTESFETKSEALKRELEIKKLSHSQKEALISGAK